MYLKCPRCRDHSVLEREVARMEWRRCCTTCGFLYTIVGQVIESAERDELDDALLEAVREEPSGQTLLL